MPTLYRNIIICFALLAGMWGCRPRGVLSSGRMEDVLYDLHFTDGVVSVAGLKTRHDSVKSVCYSYVLEKHGITQAQFDSSLVWYTAHPRLFDKIYPRVVARLKEEKQLMDSLVLMTGKRFEIKKAAVDNAQVEQEMQRLIERNIYGMKPVLLRSDN